MVPLTEAIVCILCDIFHAVSLQFEMRMIPLEYEATKFVCTG